MQRATTPHKVRSAVRPTVKPEKMDIHRSLGTAAIRAEDRNQHADRTLTTNYQDPPNQSVITNQTSPCQIVDTTAFSHHLDLPLPVIKPPLATSTWQNICHSSQSNSLDLPLPAPNLCNYHYALTHAYFQLPPQQ